jgi:hypothetical protein
MPRVDRDDEHTTAARSSAVAGSPAPASDPRLARRARRAGIGCGLAAGVFTASDAALVPAGGWLLLAGLAVWFVFGVWRVQAACRTGHSRAVGRRVIGHFLPLTIAAAAVPVLASLGG